MIIIILFVAFILFIGGLVAIYLGMKNHNKDYRTIGIIVTSIALLLFIAGLVSPENQKNKGKPETTPKSWTDINPLYKQPYQPPAPLDKKTK